MASKLSQLFNPYPYGDRGVYTNPYASSPLANQTLPNGGGTYNPAGKSTITPPSLFTGGVETPAQVTPNLYEKYRDPKTGEIMSPEEYAIYLGNKIPKGNGDITNYAGDAMTNPNQTAQELTGRATDLNNARNDIATGETDPYKVGNQSGIAYSPAELKAIESAYAGVYDPALKDVFARLKEKEDEEAAKAAREETIFRTNESIRQWKATTGSKSTGSGGSAKDIFTQSQLNNGAVNAGMSIAAFADLDDDIKNFYINPPMALNDEERKVPIYENFNEDMELVRAGELDADELSDNIMNNNLPDAVKHYFIAQIPEQEEKKKEGYFGRIWNAITNKK